MNNMELNEFIDIQGFEGLYQINRYGGIRNFDQKIKRGYCIANIKSRVMKHQIWQNGYPGLVLTKDGKKKRVHVHRILAIHFIPNPDKKKYVNHKDGDKKNYSLDNLEWSTQSENMKHAFATKLATPVILKGDKNWASKIICDLQSGIFYHGVREAAEAKNLSKIQLGKKLRGERTNNTSLIFA